MTDLLKPAEAARILDVSRGHLMPSGYTFVLERAHKVCKTRIFQTGGRDEEKAGG
jgi:hypothetical protein